MYKTLQSVTMVPTSYCQLLKWAHQAFCRATMLMILSSGECGVKCRGIKLFHKVGQFHTSLPPAPVYYAARDLLVK